MKALRICQWVIDALAVALAAFILATPTAQLHMVLRLRSGNTVAPHKWLVLLPVFIIVLNLWSLHDWQKNPAATPNLRRDWFPLAAEVALMALLVGEQLAG
ncbi:hypothetical protein [Lacticaseibacillus parakribbianus]|uniref:hypothetical protein n=1 Tax=Lacticaseibacillus parakribbianus TaxID=2970927 RepID=UPI0021CB809F|nr:hypothetical protein [Lacticaseibacillus parakribbianus]